MGITVKEALTIPPFNKSKIIAGELGLNKVINSVSAMDAPDLFNWITGNELILTSGYFVKHLSIYDQIMKVNAKGAAALAIKLNRYVLNIDDEAIELANELSFPLISLPFEHPWVDFVTPLVSTIINKKTAEIEHSKMLFESFTDIVLKGGDFNTIIVQLSKILNKKCALFDKNNRLICCDDESLKWRDIEQKCTHNSHKINTVISYSLIEIDSDKLNILKCKIKSGQEYYGYILLTSKNSEPNDWDVIALHQVSTVLCLEFQKNKAIAAVEKNYKDNFINDILLGLINDDEIIKLKSDFFGLKLTQGGTVIVIEFNQNYSTINSSILFQTEVKKISEYFSSSTDAVITSLADQMVVFFPYGCNIKTKIDLMTTYLNDNYNKTVYKIGVGRTFEDAGKISQSYFDAKDVIKLSANYEDRVLYYDQLGIIKLILENINQNHLNDYFHEYLGPILEYQKNNNIDLISTLSIYYQENCNIRNTAKKLFIHFNTVKYRLNLIEEILSHDIDDPNIKNTLSIALQLLNFVSITPPLLK